MTVKIAIDGPAGAGKSTAAKKLAKLLGFTYIDTGAMYRAITLKVLRENISLEDEERIVEVARKSDISLDGERVFLDGEDVSEEIRKPIISEKVSVVSQIPEVREILVKKQRKIAEGKNVVMDGRDIGTVVLPDAQFKFFLTASLEERARRRYEELKNKGTEVKYEEVLEEIKKRDSLDSGRKTSPLTIPEGAILIDTTDLTEEEVVERVYEAIRKNTKGEI
ncbi:MAG: Cytidylate kinase [Caldanaerobacter subterraneus]|uniref:Cytidylate kinase n=1 Tax=Caldanaerobacter subterraneus TaxID=911092 RepID=A0A117KWF0_9THEO|nr:(d)CMP kinase [Caldanaerobacter subterraneus]KUK09668.1 MAG: Cytidylate kinase [Caldanaerobacter subterraneus]HBT48756.1 (d)CMP kinase [Caldanaerobacter subterraneus]